MSYLHLPLTRVRPLDACDGAQYLKKPKTHDNDNAPLCCALSLQMTMTIPHSAVLYHCRFRDFPLVNHPPYVRSYVGAPVVLANGHRVGAMGTKKTATDAAATRLLVNVAGLSSMPD